MTQVLVPSVITPASASSRLEPLRVAIFHATLPPATGRKGGVEATVHRLAEALAREEGVEVTVLSCDDLRIAASYRHRTLGRFALHNGPSGVRDKLLRYVVLPLMLNVVDFRAFDIVHLHGDDWFWFRRRLPTIRTLHGSALREAQTARRFARKALQYCIYPLEHISSRLATRSVAVGADTQRIYDTDAIVGCGVDLALFSPREKAPNPSLVFIGGWNDRKRGSLAFKTFVDEILPRHPDAKLHMIGDFAPEHPHVTLHRGVDDEMLAELLARAWLFFYPTSYEGFGVPYVEALASGTAIVTTKNPGAIDVLDGDRFGVVCEDADFGAKTLELLDDTERRRLLEGAGPARAGTFSTTVTAARYLQLYRDAIKHYEDARIAHFR
jgi:phosphatidyl-myo-inositol alpha-mannosyltransferase